MGLCPGHSEWETRLKFKVSGKKRLHVTGQKPLTLANFMFLVIVH